MQKTFKQVLPLVNLKAGVDNSEDNWKLVEIAIKNTLPPPPTATSSSSSATGDCTKSKSATMSPMY
ncbi:unnamed protein product [Mucor fragilis]